MKFQELVNLTESSTTVFDEIKWTQNGSLFKANARLGSSEFVLYIEPQNITVDGEELTYLNLAFSRVLDGVETQLLVGSNEKPSAAIGAVTSAMRNKLKQIDADYEVHAVVLAANATEIKRLSLYERIVRSKSYGLYPWQYGFKTVQPEGEAIVALKSKPESKFISSLKTELAKSGRVLVKE